MDFDLFLTYPRWDILEIISKKPSSPLEISKKIGTTVSYVSQQLKLLDAAGLLTKVKTGAAERGKPRTLFGLSNEIAYLSVLTKDFSDKKLFHLSNFHKTILRIWLIPDSSLHYYIEKIFWELEGEKKQVEGFFVGLGSPPSILIICNSKTLEKRLSSLINNFDRKFNLKFISKKDLSKFEDNLFSVYDPSNLLYLLKGGNDKSDT